MAPTSGQAGLSPDSPHKLHSLTPPPPEQLAVCDLYLEDFMCFNYTPPAVCLQDPNVKRRFNAKSSAQETG